MPPLLSRRLLMLSLPDCCRLMPIFLFCTAMLSLLMLYVSRADAYAAFFRCHMPAAFFHTLAAADAA